MTDFGSLEYQQKLSMELETWYVHVLLVGDFVVLPLEWILNLEASQHSLQHVKTEVRNCAFLVILVLLLLNVGGCGGQPLSSKFILKVKKQNPLPKEHVHITFLTPWIVFVGILGFQSWSRHYEKPCRYLSTLLIF